MCRICENLSIALIVIIVILLDFQSSYEKIDAFSILSNNEFAIRKGCDTTIFIRTNGYNKINSVIINDDNYDGIHFTYPQKTYPINGLSDTIYVEYFQKSPSADVASVKSVRSSLFLITDLSDSDQDERPIYRVEIKKDRVIQIYKATLLLNSKMDEHKVVFNFR